MKVLHIFIWGFMMCCSLGPAAQTGGVQSIFESLDKHKKVNWLDILADSDQEGDQPSPRNGEPETDSSLNPRQLDQIRKAKLAALLEKKFQEQRTKIEESTKIIQRPILKSSYLYPERRKIVPGEPNTGYHSSLLEQPLSILSSAPYGDKPKILRYAEEAKAGLRPGGLRQKAHPVFPKGAEPPKLPQEEVKESQYAPSSASPKTDFLSSRIGSSGFLSFDPSIIVNFTLIESSLVSRDKMKETAEKQSRKSTSDLLKVISRPSTKDKPKYLYNYPSESDEDIFFQSEQKSITKRAKVLELPSKTYSNMSYHEPMALYIAVKPPATNKLTNPRIIKEHHQRKAFTDNLATQPSEASFSEFGPYSQGNDPKAGIDPSEVKLPEMDISKLSLPQSVRESLKNYLEPLLLNLRPLTKSVPGLPGLDYPILSVVPYTNFYCNNMPFAGFYADTEARCQAWHACDVDGRQATFLCPNGTIFNQALMVCDWWYNSNCLDAPFYYTLNKRLFGHLAQPRPAIPYNRITLELLDTIFL